LKFLAKNLDLDLVNQVLPPYKPPCPWKFLHYTTREKKKRIKVKGNVTYFM
jgi:hypothetical protein